METSGQDLHGHDRSSDVINGGRLSVMSVMSRAAEWIERIDRSYTEDVMQGENLDQLASICEGCHYFIHHFNSGRKKEVA